MSYQKTRYNTLRLLINDVERRILEHRSKEHLKPALLIDWNAINETLLAEKEKREKEMKELVEKYPEYFV